MNVNNPSKGKISWSPFFLGQGKIILLQLLSDIRLFHDFFLSLCPPPNTLLHLLQDLYIQLHFQLTVKKKNTKKKTEQNSEVLCSGKYIQHMALLLTVRLT